jgi:hypothetical protein
VIHGWTVLVDTNAAMRRQLLLVAHDAVFAGCPRIRLRSELN